MDQSTENTVKKCEIVVDAQNNTTNTLKSVRKKILSTISISRRKANENFDDQKEMNQDKSGDESFGKSKITIKKIFRKSSFRKFISNINFTNFTVSSFIREKERERGREGEKKTEVSIVRKKYA